MFSLQDQTDFYNVEASLPSCLIFELQLNQLITVCEPGARTIECLEAAQTTPADVYLFWVAMMAAMKDALGNQKLGLPASVCSEIRGIINFRWRGFFLDGPSQLHLTAFYLNPSK